MAVKKKLVSTNANIDRRRVSADNNRGINNSGKIVGFTPVKATPTEALAAKGQKATGLAKREGPFGASSFLDEAGKKSGVKSQKALDAVNASASIVSQVLLAEMSGAVAGKVAGAAISKVASRYGKAAAEGAFDIAAKGLGASGKGGKIKNVMTPFGKTIASTNIGTKAAQAARMENLVTRAEQISVGGLRGAKTKGAADATKVILGAKAAGRVAGAVAAAKTVTKSSKGNNKRK